MKVYLDEINGQIELNQNHFLARVKKAFDFICRPYQWDHKKADILVSLINKWQVKNDCLRARSDLKYLYSLKLESDIKSCYIF